MTDRTSEASSPVPVTIFGRTYQLRGAEDAAYLSELAEVVDTKMRDVATSTGTADTLSVAVLASLNLADDYLRASTSGGKKSQTTAADKRLARMVALLDEALTP
jgi:cell division protein ZapA